MKFYLCKINTEIFISKMIILAAKFRRSNNIASSNYTGPTVKHQNLTSSIRCQKIWRPFLKEICFKMVCYSRKFFRKLIENICILI
jgi:hypothetical protein